MPKRNLRIVRRGANIPVVGICEYCNAQFSADPTGRTIEGQPSVQEQFDAHKCKRQEAARIVREATEDESGLRPNPNADPLKPWDPTR
jgi:hypothetical protein